MMNSSLPFDPERPRYYILSQDIELHQRFEFLNEASALIDGQMGGQREVRLRDLDFSYQVGLPPLKERPKILVGSYDNEDPRPMDLYGDDDFFISTKLKDILCNIDPTAFEMVECDAYDAAGNAIDSYWWIDVTTVLDAVDESRSIFTRQTDNPFSSGEPVDSVRYLTLNDIHMDCNVVSNHHIFKLIPDGQRTVVDEIVADICRSNGIRGVAFTHLQPPTPNERSYRFGLFNNEYWNDLGYLS